MVLPVVLAVVLEVLVEQADRAVQEIRLPLLQRKEIPEETILQAALLMALVVAVVAVV